MNKQFFLNTRLTVTEKDAGGDQESDTLVISGYASTNDKDRDGDVIEAGAWNKPSALKSYLNNPIILAYHDHKQPIGKMVEHSIDERGLHIVAEISKAAGNVYELIKDGILGTFSVGFMIKDADWDSKADIFRIKEVELFETSVVTIPANASATFSVGKSFDSEDEYKNFKQQFETIKEEDLMPKGIDNNDKPVITAPGLSAEEVAAIVAKSLEARDARQAKVKAEKEASIALVSGAVKEATDRLEADMNAKLEKASESEGALTDTIAELTAQIGEQGVALKAAAKNKMRYNGESEGSISVKERDEAILLAKCMNKPMEKTVYGKSIIEKAAPDSEGTNVPSAEWETLFNTRVLEELRESLKLEPLFNKIAMPSSTYKFPVNPEAGVAGWVNAAAAGIQSKTRAGSTASSGAVANQVLTDLTLVSKKMATKTFIGYEEEEDAIFPIMSIIREAMIRRMARATDQSILLGTASGLTGAATGINGLLDFGNETEMADVAGTALEKVTALVLMAARARLGRHGLDLSKLVHLVDITQYYNLVEDANFLTIDKIGPQATLLSGQVGMVSGVPVVVTEAFPAAAAGGVCAATIYTPNYIVGEQKGLTVESDKRVEEQDNLLIATRRFDFQEIETGLGAEFINYNTTTI